MGLNSGLCVAQSGYSISNSPTTFVHWGRNRTSPFTDTLEAHNCHDNIMSLYIAASLERLKTII